MECNRCGGTIHDSLPHYSDKDSRLCWDCSYIEGKIKEREYLDCCGVYLKKARAVIRNGQVFVCVGKPPWEKGTQDYRRNTHYKHWRRTVFERDEYICQDCLQIGGNLEAHHIKPFKKYKKLRYLTSNGVTLCRKCHRKRHRKTA